MSADLEVDDAVQRRLQGLEHRYRRAQENLANTQTAYAALREVSGASDLRLHQALKHVELAQRRLVDLHNAIRLAEDWGYIG